MRSGIDLTMVCSWWPFTVIFMCLRWMAQGFDHHEGAVLMFPMLQTEVQLEFKGMLCPQPRQPLADNGHDRCYSFGLIYSCGISQHSLPFRNTIGFQKPCQWTRDAWNASFDSYGFMGMRHDATSPWYTYTKTKELEDIYTYIISYMVFICLCFLP